MENTDTPQPEDEQKKADAGETDAYYGGDAIGDGELDLSFLDEGEEETASK